MKKKITSNIPIFAHYNVPHLLLTWIDHTIILTPVNFHIFSFYELTHVKTIVLSSEIIGIIKPINWEIVKII